MGEALTVRPDLIVGLAVVAAYRLAANWVTRGIASRSALHKSIPSAASPKRWVVPSHCVILPRMDKYVTKTMDC